MATSAPTTTDLLLRSIATHSSSGASRNSARMKRNSLLGSIKDKLRRNPGNDAQRPAYEGPSGTTAAARPDRPGQLPQPQLQPSAADRSPNPFANPSPPTRRPRNEAPPAYSENPTVSSGPTIPETPAYSARAASPAPSNRSAAAISITTPEDQYAFLSSFDTVFLIDDSGSMAGRSWREVKAALSFITPICTSHDKDGVDVYFINHETSARGDKKNGIAPCGYNNIADDAAIDRIFTTVRPYGATNIGARLNAILKAYIVNYEAQVKAKGDPDETGVKPINIIAITDGVPTDDPETVLVRWAKKLDALDAPPHQVGVQFFQVGNEPGASKALQTLDDGLANIHGGIRDMVDTVTFSGSGARTPVLSGEAILKTVLGAVVKRYDRTQLEFERRSQRNFLTA